MFLFDRVFFNLVKPSILVHLSLAIAGLLSANTGKNDRCTSIKGFTKLISDSFRFIFWGDIPVHSTPLYETMIVVV